MIQMPSAKTHKPHEIARILVLILLIVFFEGALRKWLIPGTTLIWMLLRDGLVAYGIAIAISRSWLRMKSWQEGMFIAWTILVTVWATLQVVAEKQPLIVAAIGLRSWLFYMWFAWVCARTLTRDDVEWVLRVIALTIIPFAILATIQHLLPPGSPLNKQGEGGEIKDIFMAGGAVRTTATFSFSSGFSAYLLFVCPIALSALIGQLSLRPAMFRWLIFIAWAAAVLAAGARQSVFTGAVMLGGLLIAIAVRRRTRDSKGNSFVGLIFLAATFVSLPFAIPTAIESNRSRFETAAASESLGYRLGILIVGNKNAWANFPMTGEGIGLGNNAAGPLMGGTQSFLLAEDENGRTLLEAGLLGLAFLIAKWAIVLKGLTRAFSVLRTSGDVLPWLMWLCLAAQIPSPMLGQLTAHAFAWLTLALAWASLNPSRKTLPSINKRLIYTRTLSNGLQASA